MPPPEHGHADRCGDRREPTDVDELLETVCRKRLTRSSQPAWNISTWSIVRPVEAREPEITVWRSAIPTPLPTTQAATIQPSAAGLRRAIA